MSLNRNNHVTIEDITHTENTLPKKNANAIEINIEPAADVVENNSQNNEDTEITHNLVTPEWVVTAEDIVANFNKRFGSDAIVILKDANGQVLFNDLGSLDIDINDELKDILLENGLPPIYRFGLNQNQIDSNLFVDVLGLVLLKKNLSELKKRSAPIDVVDKLDALANVIIEEGPSASNSIVLHHFVNISDELKNGKQFTAEEVAQDMQWLDKKLYGTRPLSARVVAAIAGVVGAIVGFALGVTLGAIATHGVGAIPAGIAAAFKGFTLGIQIGTVLGVFGGIFAGEVGFFSARRKEILHASTTPSVDLQTKIDAVNESIKPRAMMV